MSFTLPQLPYAFDALEPHIDAKTMEIHYSKHHQAYTTNLNNAIVGTEMKSKSIEELLQSVSSYSPAVRNNAGGFYNHNLFWEILSPTPQKEVNGILREKIEQKWGSIEEFKTYMKQVSMARFGSGWTWLYVKYNGEIEVTTTANQDNPMMDTNLTDRGFPILGIDLWEHAYYLNYQNMRADYLDALWEIIDWKKVEEKYAILQGIL